MLGSNAVSSHARVIEQHANLTALSANDLHFRDISDCLDLIVNLRCNASEGEVVVAITGKSERQYRHVIYRTRLDGGELAPAGIRSKLADIFWLSRTMLPSSFCPT